MPRYEMPRVSELIDLIEDQGHSGAYFKEFEQTVLEYPEKHRVWLAREKELQELDPGAWDFLKAELSPYLAARVNGRGWEQLISLLNQARAYKYLRDCGCSKIRFIPRALKSEIQTPDLEGVVDGGLVLCEVKTINISDKEIGVRSTETCRSTEAVLSAGFFKKFTAFLIKAKDQMASFSNVPKVRRVVFVVINFDDRLGEYKDWYYEQIDNYLKVDSIPKIEVVLFNQRTCFHKTVQMSYAVVINE